MKYLRFPLEKALEHCDEEGQENSRPVECIVIEDWEHEEEVEADDCDPCEDYDACDKDSKCFTRYQRIKVGIILRLVALGALLFFFAFAIVMGLVSALLGVVAALYLFRNASINRRLRRSWSAALRAWVAGLGFAVAVVAPIIGFGLISLYFSVLGFLNQEEILRRALFRPLRTP